MCQTDNAKSLAAWAHTVPSSWSCNTQPLWVLRNVSVQALPPACPESSPDLWTTAEILQALIYFVGLRNSTRRERLSVRLPTMGPLLFLGVCVDVFAHHGCARSSVSRTVQGISDCPELTFMSLLCAFLYAHLCIQATHFWFMYAMWRFRQSPMALYVRDPARLVKVPNLESILVKH